MKKANTLIKDKKYKEMRLSPYQQMNILFLNDYIRLKAWALLGMGNAKEVIIWEEPSTMDLVFKYR